MEESLVGYHASRGVATLVLNRPQVLNSFNREMALQMQSALAQARDDEQVRSILLRAEGRAFCAGQDLSEAVAHEGEEVDVAQMVRDHYNPIIGAIRLTEKPVIAAVQGVAAGAGANLALCCDFVVASTEASFIQAFCKVGLIPDSGGSFFLPRLVGLARATALAMLGEPISAEAAFEVGLIYKVCEAATLENEAEHLARHLASLPTVALGLIKRSLNQSTHNSLSDQLELEAQLQALAARSHDHREGVRAFLEKRKPQFKGR